MLKISCQNNDGAFLYFLDTASARAFNLCLMMSNSFKLHLFTAVLMALTHFEVMEGSGGVAESCISPF